MSLPPDIQVPSTYSTKELECPETAEEFEALCFALYKAAWDDPSCSRVGRSGQKQFGLDILGMRGEQRIAVQCKKYRGKLPLSVIKADIKEADDAGISIDHLLFATTAQSDAKLVIDVAAISDARKKEGKFTVSIDSWSEISTQLYSYPHVGKTHVTNFPGSAPLALATNVQKTFDAVQGLNQKFDEYMAGGLTARTGPLGLESLAAQALPNSGANSIELDRNVVRTLDLSRDKIRSGRIDDAEELLELLGDPAHFHDPYSKFRYYTNQAAILLGRGDKEQAAELYLRAFVFAPEVEKAITNRCFAHLLLGLPEKSLASCEEALEKFPESAELWGTRIRVQVELGLAVSIDDIPASVRTHSSVAFAIAEYHRERGEIRAAIAQLKQLTAETESSLDAKRFLLAQCLEWVLSDKVSALCGQIPRERRDALQDAVTKIGRAEDLLSSLQSKPISEEIANNLTVSTWLLGKKESAEKICDLFLTSIGPFDPLVRFKILRLAERHDSAEIRRILDGVDQSTLSLETALIIAEIAANFGDMAWFESASSLANGLDLASQHRLELDALRSFVRFEAGDKDGAIESLKQLIQENPIEFVPLCLLSSLLLRSEKKVEAESFARRALELAGSQQGSESLILADIFFELDRYHEAASLYEAIVQELGADWLSRRLLACLLEDDQRRKCWELLETLPSEIRSTSQIRTIEINLCRRSGNIDRMRLLLKDELAASPQRADVALGFAYTLYQLGEQDELRAFLQGNRQFSDTRPSYEIELAKFQSYVGLEFDAWQRLYMLLKANPADTIVAGHYLSHILLSGAPSPALDEVQVGSVVKLISGSEVWYVAIDSNGPFPWPELVAPASPTAVELIGRRVGDELEIERGVIKKIARIDSISSIFSFAADKAHELLSKSAESKGPVAPVHVLTEDGELDHALFVSVAKQRRERCESALAAYRAGGLPVCVLASMLGTDSINLLLDWPYRECPLNIGSATVGEREESQRLLEGVSKRFVTDLFTLAEMHRWGVVDAIAAQVGRLALPASAKEHLLGVIQLHERIGPSGSICESDGMLIWSETSPEEHSSRGLFLYSLLGLLGDSVDLCETLGPPMLEARIAGVIATLEKSFADSILLTLELNGILLSEDPTMRSLATLGGGRETIGIQPILERALHFKKLDITKYSDVVVGKMSRGHQFVSVSAPVLNELAARSKDCISGGARVALVGLRNKSLDLKSGIKVVLEFIKILSRTRSAGLVAPYVVLCREVLTEGREEMCKVIDYLISEQLQAIYGRNGRRLNSEQRRRFGELIRRRDKPIIP